MWEMRLARPFGGLSVRKLLLLVAGVLATIFSFATTPVSAQAAPDAKWANETQLVYENNTYSRGEDAVANDPRGIPEGAVVFFFVDKGTMPETHHHVYFLSNQDVATANNAQYTNARFDGDAPTGEQYSDVTSVKLISLEPFRAPTLTSCNQEGIGYIICPLTNWLAKGMDTLYSLISGFLEVRPPQTNTENALYRAWSMMRNFANVVFVIAFLIIIYSQITTFGISNYNIKKMLPRLVVAAILVNVSYWICAIAIDLSNILGYSIQDLLMNLRENLVGAEGNQWELINWQSITGAVLTAGTGVGALTVGTVVFLGSGGASIFLLFPMLLGVLTAVLIALLIMAARQAIITILLVISPLAFVAFLLPNTEKYFEKWRGLGMTMLLMFPIFSVIFGGAQLAGAIIIQHADSINLVILGLAVQVAPLVITPLLIRFSGSILGKVAGIVNNPNRGLIDRTRKWSQERADQMKSRQLAKGNNWFANRARGIDTRRRNREGWQKSHDAMTEAKWGKTAKASDIQQYAMRAADVKQVGDSDAQSRYNVSKATNSEMQDLDLQARAAKLNVDMTTADIDANWEEVLAGNARTIVAPENLSVQALAHFRREQDNRAQRLSGMVMQTSANTRRASAAKGEQAQRYANELDTNAELLRTAVGIDSGGEAKVQAAAISEIIEAKNKNVTAGIELMKSRALKNGQTLKQYATSVTKDVKAGNGARHNEITIEAAYDAVAQDGQVVILEEARMSGNVNQDMLSRVIARNAGTLKTKGGYHLQEDPGLAGATPEAMNKARAASLADTSASNMKELKQSWVKAVEKDIVNIMDNGAPADLERTYANIHEALTNENIAPTITEMRDNLQAIEQALKVKLGK